MSDGFFTSLHVSLCLAEQINCARYMYLFNSAGAIVCASLHSFPFSNILWSVAHLALVFLLCFSYVSVIHAFNIFLHRSCIYSGWDESFLTHFCKEIRLWKQSVERICIILWTAWKVKCYQSARMTIAEILTAHMWRNTFSLSESNWKFILCMLISWLSYYIAFALPPNCCVSSGVFLVFHVWLRSVI